MNIYVAGRMSDPVSLARVRSVMGLVEDAGFRVSMDWSSLPDNGPDEDLSPEVSRRIAEAELDALYDSDLLIVLYEDNALGPLIEAGICIAHGIPTWVVPCGGRASIWWHLPTVKFVNESDLPERLSRV